MIVKFFEIEDFIKKHLCFQPGDAEDTSCSVFRVNECLKPIDAVKLNFHLVILSTKGKCDITVGHHDFSIESSAISIVPPHTVFSVKHFSNDFDAYFLLFKSDFVKKGFVKSEIMEELLFINPDYPPIFNLEEKDFNDTRYKFRKIKEETENQSPFCLEVSRLYVLQILYDYNRVCEICLLNADKLINRQYKVMYEFRKLVDKNFHRFKTVKEYADLMCLSSKYVSECVKNQTGVSALTLIQNRIVLEAELLLKYYQLSIKCVSDKLGFASTSTFSRFFKGIKGVSPVHYQSKQEN
ncbi:helix-turn-helix domain-containing protein [Sphingobacterium olei]|uniref:Helix-turn-helix domain-containing protein n=1 Tax=Sphingobacterium olei TaxID=2571155 RepID=A0A4U0PBQ8_9SPHI|nr:helix-turn-helix domain-containing protein [Sphingobacterium olei]TJZ60084.1 helix-turn-helix domain-containing protein [Sphingobacterium olei]